MADSMAFLVCRNRSALRACIVSQNFQLLLNNPIQNYAPPSLFIETWGAFVA
jgi:hypothetical protein